MDSITNKNNKMNVIKKSKGVSLLLTLLFGPLGLLYSSKGGAILLTILTVISFPTVIIPVLCWLASMVIGEISVIKHNKNVDATIALLGGKN